MYYTVCVCAYITEKRNKTSSRRELLLLKSDDRAQQNGVVFTRELLFEMRFERKKKLRSLV